MQVLFDLRPQHLIQIQYQKVDVIRVLIVIFFVGFVGISIFNIANMVFRLHSVTSELSMVQAQRASVSASLSTIQTRIAEFRALRDRIRAYLEFTKQELPTVEFLSTLESAVTSGLKVANIDIRAGSVTMRGSGVTDQDVMDFVNGLDNMKYIITKVDPPSMTKSTLGNRLITDFSLSCNIKSVTEVGVALPQELSIRTTVGDETQPVPAIPEAPAETPETPETPAVQGEETQTQ
jgi:hypothetical protein